MEQSDKSPTTVASDSKRNVFLGFFHHHLSSVGVLFLSVFDFRSSRNFSCPLIIHPPFQKEDKSSWENNALNK